MRTASECEYTEQAERNKKTSIFDEHLVVPSQW
jgi:hypothetical protein